MGLLWSFRLFNHAMPQNGAHPSSEIRAAFRARRTPTHNRLHLPCDQKWKVSGRCRRKNCKSWSHTATATHCRCESARECLVLCASLPLRFAPLVSFAHASSSLFLLPERPFKRSMEAWRGWPQNYAQTSNMACQRKHVHCFTSIGNMAHLCWLLSPHAHALLMLFLLLPSCLGSARRL